MRPINFIAKINLVRRNTYLDGIYLFKVNNGNSRKMCEICSKLTEWCLLNLKRFDTLFWFSVVHFQQTNKRFDKLLWWTNKCWLRSHSKHYRKSTISFVWNYLWRVYLYFIFMLKLYLYVDFEQVFAYWLLSLHLLVQSSNGNKRTKCEICSKLSIEALDRHQWRRCGVFINLE